MTDERPTQNIDLDHEFDLMWASIAEEQAESPVDWGGAVVYWAASIALGIVLAALWLRFT